MPERPLLNLPVPIAIEPRVGPKGGPRIIKPSRSRQGERLGPRFERLMRVAGNPQAIAELRNDPASIAPERAIVFEVAGSLEDFYTQAHALGLDYLGDFEQDIHPSADFRDTKSATKVVAGRIYLAMPDVRALQELVRLWRLYQEQPRMPDGTGAWSKLFSLLIDVRPWGPQDRVPPETIAYWQSELARNSGAPVRFEIELWYYENATTRRQAQQRLEAEVQRLGGVVVHLALLPEIRYHAALVDIPSTAIQDLLAHPDVTLARVDEIMFLRPQTVARAPAKDDLEGEEGEDSPGIEGDFANREPVAALLDGLPIQNHVRLAGRLVVDDPFDVEPTYPVDRREHGTAMASLIIHGDLNRAETAIPRPLFVLPVMRPDGLHSEHTPSDRLLVDVIYQAVRRIKEGDGNQPASAPSVSVINLSLADPWRPFARVMSPLGRLLDYLAHRYRVLFLVSAGNITDRLVVTMFNTSREFEDASPEDRERAILAALNDNKSQRTLLSPAEAVNVLTIGAAHSGSAFNGGLPANLFDPFTDEGLPNIASAMGLGFRKTVKPDLLLEGGRAPVRVVGSGSGVTIVPVQAPVRLFGARVAFPDRLAGTRHEDFTWGTSVATALATRAAHRLHDVLMDREAGSNHADIPQEYMALVLKALLVHGASWGPKAEMLDVFFGPHGKGSQFERRDNIARLLGYGVPNLERVLDCTANRATLLGFGTLQQDHGLLYRIPLPADLEGQRVFRALTVTLAWLSPVNPRHQGYRAAALDISPGSDDRFWIASERNPYQPTDKATARGTVFHERRQGDDATVFVDDGHILLRVSCRATAGDLDESVPFALAISFEVAIESGIHVYDQIRARLAAPVRAGVGTGAGRGVAGP